MSFCYINNWSPLGNIDFKLLDVLGIGFAVIVKVPWFVCHMKERIAFKVKIFKAFIKDATIK